MSRIPPAEVEAVMTRARWFCEGCGAREGGKMELHHRQARQMGGSKRNLDVAANLVRLHQRCHAWLHDHPDIAKEHGLIVESWDDYTKTLPRLYPALYRLARVSL